MNIDFIEGGNIKTYEKDIESNMNPHIDHLKKELAKIRTGRAHPSMIEDVKISCYGTTMSLKEVASVSAPDSALLVVQPWDMTIINEIEKGIAASDAGLTPQNDGEIIRLKLPPMSAARRDELVKILNQKVEICKVAIRNDRKDIMNKIRDTEKAKKVSEDFAKRLQDMLQKVTDKFITLSDQVSQQKEGEIKSL